MHGARAVVESSHLIHKHEGESMSLSTSKKFHPAGNPLFKYMSPGRPFSSKLPQMEWRNWFMIAMMPMMSEDTLMTSCLRALCHLSEFSDVYINCALGKPSSPNAPFLVPLKNSCRVR